MVEGRVEVVVEHGISVEAGSITSLVGVGKA